MPALVTTPAPAAARISEQDTPNSVLIRRMLALAWRYRAACVRVVIQQLLLVVLGLSGLGLTGLGIDVIRRAAAPQTAAPRWPWGSEISADWPPLLLVGGIALTILLLALVQSTL